MCTAGIHNLEHKLLSGCREGRKSFEDSERSGRPQTSRNSGNIETISCRLQTIAQIAESGYVILIGWDMSCVVCLSRSE
ncbi:hypothetical protein TNCV_1737061 [Trichonephila clavipes]|nr:hypothetical protein TNCV_1737061 [Trichonephila clavipes]